MAKQVQQIAKKEQRSISDLFREAFRSYRAHRALQAFADLDHIGKARKGNASNFTEVDVERLVQDTRRELEAVRKPKRNAAAVKK